MPGTSSVLLVGSGKSSTIYQIETGNSFNDKKTIIRRRHCAVLALNEEVIVLGGSAYSTRVEKYDMASGEFVLANALLKEGRTRFGVVTVPAKMFGHLPGGCNA